MEEKKEVSSANIPICPVFGECGGCLHQDMAYTSELVIKEEGLKKILPEGFALSEGVIEPIVASPQFYHYRNRLDLKIQRTKTNGVLIGFTPRSGRGIVPVQTCLIADEKIAGFIPKLKEEAVSKLTPRYRQANLTVRTGDGPRVLWGGIGRRSCRLAPADYLWTQIEGKKIFYSLDTFFQANLSILPELFRRIRAFDFWNPQISFYDLYGGVGLFGIGLAERVKKVILIEECPSSLELARHNVQYHQLKNFEIIAGKVEDALPSLLPADAGSEKVAIVDPPRAGLSEQALALLTSAKEFNRILYLSCHPQSLARDLKEFLQKGRRIERVIPFDFFPRTKHLEILVVLVNNQIPGDPL